MWLQKLVLESCWESVKELQTCLDGKIYRKDRKMKKKVIKMDKGMKILIVLFFGALVLMSVLQMSYARQPQYRTEYYKEPVYGTVYYGWLKDTGPFMQSDKVYNFDNALSFDMLYTRTGSLKEYMFTITNFGGTQSYYYDIDTWNINNKQGIVRYEEKTRQVCIENCN